MKSKLKISLISLGLAVLIVAGCKKDNNGVVTKMNATIDGKTWNTTLRATVKNNTGFVITGTQVTTSLVTSTLVININGLTTGTYNVIASNNTCLATYTPDISNATKSFVSASGSVVLTEVNTNDKTISGTFSFTCTNLSFEPVLIENGTFAGLSYTVTSDN